MSERNSRLDNFYRCEYGNVKDAWEIKEAKGYEAFTVVYLCSKVKGRCIEAYKNKKQCPYVGNNKQGGMFR